MGKNKNKSAISKKDNSGDVYNASRLMEHAAEANSENQNLVNFRYITDGDFKNSLYTKHQHKPKHKN